MNLYRRLFFPFLRRLDAESAHEATLCLLSLAQRTPLGRLLLRKVRGEVPCRPVSVFGLTFPNVLGVAAGFDKDATAPLGLALLGFGHVELGTITPWPQAGNPRPRIFRLPCDRALINRMGFPNAGMVQAARRLRSVPRNLPGQERTFVLGVSLGKQKETPLLRAVDDYVAVMRAVYPYADYLAVNVSSPNTPGLRDLQGKAYLSDLLGRLVGERSRLAGAPDGARPLLLKVAPDLTWAELDQILQVATDHEVDGLIATNTSLARAGLTHGNRHEAGGLSGAPLAERSNEIIAYVHRQVGHDLPIIGVGGVFGADDVKAKLAAGAALVQLYTGLVYQGPGLPGHLLRSL